MQDIIFYRALIGFIANISVLLFFYSDITKEIKIILTTMLIAFNSLHLLLIILA